MGFSYVVFKRKFSFIACRQQIWSDVQTNVHVNKYIIICTHSILKSFPEKTPIL